MRTCTSDECHICGAFIKLARLSKCSKVFGAEPELSRKLVKLFKTIYLTRPTSSLWINCPSQFMQFAPNRFFSIYNINCPIMISEETAGYKIECPKFGVSALSA
jgi:hypothetical protein